MSHYAAIVGLLALTHICCLAVMTERKYSVRKTALIYALYAAYFVGCMLLVSTWMGPESQYAAPVMFSFTIVVGFFVFILTSSDVFCKKLFLFIGYSNLFCILQCAAVLISSTLFPSLSGTEMRYARVLRERCCIFRRCWHTSSFSSPHANGPGKKRPDVVFHFSGLYTVSGCFCIFCDAFLSA